MLADWINEFDSSVTPSDNQILYLIFQAFPIIYDLVHVRSFLSPPLLFQSIFHDAARGAIWYKSGLCFLQFETTQSLPKALRIKSRLIVFKAPHALDLAFIPIKHAPLKLTEHLYFSDHFTLSAPLFMLLSQAEVTFSTSFAGKYLLLRETTSLVL